MSAVQDAVIETNGTVSVLQKAEDSPVTPKQLSLSVAEKSTPVPVVTDGKPTSEYFGENKIKLGEIELLAEKSGRKICEIMLLTSDSQGNVFMIPKEEKK